MTYRRKYRIIRRYPYVTGVPRYIVQVRRFGLWFSFSWLWESDPHGVLAVGYGGAGKYARLKDAEAALPLHAEAYERKNANWSRVEKEVTMVVEVLPRQLMEPSFS